MEPYPHQFATALFSFLYHLASYDAGGEALVSCGMMEALLKVCPDPTNISLPSSKKAEMVLFKHLHSFISKSIY